MRLLLRLLAVPAFILVIAFQVYWPIAVVRAVSAFDPLDHSIICSISTNASSDRSDDAPSQGQQNVCPICQFAAISQTLPLIEPAVIPAIAGVAEKIVFDPSQSAGPRGPPRSGLPPTRAPPSLA